VYTPDLPALVRPLRGNSDLFGVRRPHGRPLMALKPGDVIEVPEHAYKYGVGVLKLRITRIRRELLACYEGKEVWIHGHVIHWNGEEDREELSFLIQVSALPGGTV
jgi:hypothetical protein